MCVCISSPLRRSPEGCAAQSERAVLPVNVVSMIREFFDPAPEQQNVVLIDVATYVVGWEACSEDVELPFENILDWR